MPTYSYFCDACGKSFEKEQRIIEDPIKVCELCGKPQARRQIVSGNFILKGGGWYSDGYGSAKSSSSSSSGGSGANASSTTSAPSTSSDSTKSSDTKSSDTKKTETKSSDSAKSTTKPSGKADAAE
ncbi:MAG TPA: zinc ribbon domain-containing protein [Polyangiales bacterium]|nr:zinc ribbon domain-containing protein [Polyangiales bacterium]